MIAPRGLGFAPLEKGAIMDNNYTTEEIVKSDAENESKRSKKRRAGKIVHIAFDILFAVLSTAAFGFFAYFECGMYGILSKPIEGADGFGLAILLVFAMICGIATVVLSAITVILSGVGIKIQGGRMRQACIALTIAFAATIFITCVAFATGFIIGIAKGALTV